MEFFGFLLAPSTPLFVDRFLLQPSLNGSDGCEVPVVTVRVASAHRRRTGA
ncbi:hypothetical protein ACFYMW_09510 [Streptomyces sp. NPDC006692]|uniref:hypothetical protein n=1 Tax=unclassified Streptomyces TaxID=2593676 RepID=UPI003685DE18